MSAPRWLLVVACAWTLVGLAQGCGPKGDNEAVFAGGGGKPDPNVPQTTEEYDLKYQAGPAPKATPPRK